MLRTTYCSSPGFSAFGRQETSFSAYICFGLVQPRLPKVLSLPGRAERNTNHCLNLPLIEEHQICSICHRGPTSPGMRGYHALWSGGLSKVHPQSSGRDPQILNAANGRRRIGEGMAGVKSGTTCASQQGYIERVAFTRVWCVLGYFGCLLSRR
jgi:hypothetical protein